MATTLLISVFVLVNLIGQSLQHGRMMDPVQRSSMWRKGFNTPPNYEDTQLYCGGRDAIQRLGGLCGVCGDPYEADVRENEAGGAFANGIIVRSYPIGTSRIRVTIDLTAYHKGYYEFRICPHNNVTAPVTQECLNKYLLPVAEADVDQGEPTRYYPESGGMHELTLFLPRGISCSQCVLQWRYRTGNSWGVNKEGRGCIGCGVQEEFRNCADISIGSETSVGDVATRPKPLPVTTMRPRPPVRPRTIPVTTTTTTPSTTTARPQQQRPDVNRAGLRDRWGRPLPNTRPQQDRFPSIDRRPSPVVRPVSNRRPSPAMKRPEPRDPFRRPTRPIWRRPGIPRSQHRIGSRHNPIIQGLDVMAESRQPWGDRSFVNVRPATTTPTPVRATNIGLDWNAVLQLNLEQLRTFLGRLRMLQFQTPFRSSRTRTPTQTHSFENRLFMSPEMPMSDQSMAFRASDNTITVPGDANEAGASVTRQETEPVDIYINRYNTLSSGALEASDDPKEAWYTSVVADMKRKNNAGASENLL
ncbi:uncharacterized protein LOC117321453 [Pecten maximus]|uniref:uncharacterized protein LOC117321453 n=1 Tax=Pecten maximus TaxID=6579 RepID=UPI001458732F|nr:uncharacterized protein LOC117321453 [Pecten maximus]